MTLFKAIDKYSGKQAQALRKHLGNADITKWDDLTRARLMDFRDSLKQAVSPNSARTLCAALCAVLSRFKDEGILPYIEYSEALKVKQDKPVKTYLTSEEVERLEGMEGANDLSPNERFVLNEFVVGCKTGARISDLIRMETANISDGYLTYTSQKTGITSTLPVSDRTAERIKWLNENYTELSLVAYNNIIRRLCQRAGIDTPTKIHKGGKDKTGPKWQFISSHTARISACTNLSQLNVSLIDIMHLAGHTTPAMTARYIVRTEPKLNDRAMEYLLK